MSRATAISAILGVLVVVLAIAPTNAQRGPDRTYAQPQCGFSLNHPGGWREVPYAALGDDNRTHMLKYLLEDGNAPASFFWMEKVLVVRGGEAFLNAVQSEVGQYCLCHLRNSLVWIDRFSTESANISYTIASWGGLERPLDELMRVIRNQAGGAKYYEMQFFVTATHPGQAGPNDWVHARVLSLVPADRYRQGESVIMDMVRSLKLTPPKPTCWQ